MSNESGHVIIGPVVDSLRRFRPIGWRWKDNRVSIHITPEVSFYCNDEECECKE